VDVEAIPVGDAGQLGAGQEQGLSVTGEGFPERACNPDGSLRSRRLPGALIEDPAEAAAQALRLATQGVAITSGSQTVYAPVETLCSHGDSPHAVEIARAVQQALLA
jgi:UPF0271 protein